MTPLFPKKKEISYPREEKTYMFYPTDYGYMVRKPDEQTHKKYS